MKEKKGVIGLPFLSPASPSSWLKKRQIISQDEGDKGDFKRKGFLASGQCLFDSGLPLVAADVEFGPTEVDEEADGRSGRLEVIEALGCVEVRMLPAGLEFDDHGAFHHQVRNEITHDDSVIADFNALLLNDREPSFSQLMGQGVLVDPLEKAWAQRVGHLIRTPDDLFRQGIVDAHVWLPRIFSQDEGDERGGKAGFSKSPSSPSPWLKKKQRISRDAGDAGDKKNCSQKLNSSWLFFSPVTHGES
jgi:hypothetical protein